MNMLLEGISPTGVETTGGQDRIYLYDHMNDDRDLVIRTITDLGNRLPTIVRDALVAHGVDVTDAQVTAMASQIAGAIVVPTHGTWSVGATS
jgi:hypothetical protein